MYFFFKDEHSDHAVQLTEGHICFHGFLYPRHLLFPKGIRKDLISGHSLIDCDGHLLSERGLGCAGVMIIAL